MKETVYTSHATLRSPRAFGQALRDDLRVVGHVGWRLFVRTLQVQARQNLLSYAWLLLPALLTALVWALLGAARVVQGPDGVPYPAYVLAGTLLWQGFAEAVACPLTQLQNARGTLTKVRVPHEAFVLAGLGTVLFNQAIRLLILAAMLVWLRVAPTAALLLVPLGLASLLVLGLALGWLLAPVGLLYGDVAGGLGLGLNLWFLLTPVVYAPTGRLARLTSLNPVTPLLNSTRSWLLGGPAQLAPNFGLVAFGALALLAGAWLLYRLARPHVLVRL